MKPQFLLLLSLFLWPASSHARSVPQKMWTLPTGAYLSGLSERPGGQIGIYWFAGNRYAQFSMLNESGKLVGQGEVPGKQVMSNGIAIENWNERGQHAFLPQCGASKTNLLRLKSNGNYRTLLNLPHFDENTLQDLKFSPDGECLYVLGKSRLWIVGAQSAKLLRIVKPRWGRRWSDENAALSPDCRRILGMRGKMALFSTINGQLLNRFGVKVETLTGGCGSLEAIVGFSENGRFAVASMQDINDFETWVYSADDRTLHWHGRAPYNTIETAKGHFFLDTTRLNDYGAVSTVLRRWRDGKIGWHLKLNFEYDDLAIEPRLIFSRDGRWIYFARGKSLWRVAMPEFNRKTD